MHSYLFFIGKGDFASAKFLDYDRGFYQDLHFVVQINKHLKILVLREQREGLLRWAVQENYLFITVCTVRVVLLLQIGVVVKWLYARELRGNLSFNIKLYSLNCNIERIVTTFLDSRLFTIYFQLRITLPNVRYNSQLTLHISLLRLSTSKYLSSFLKFK